MNRSVSRSAATMGAATIVSRAIGFVRVLVVAAVLGTTYLGNTFQASNSVSNVLFELLAAGALSAVLVPAFVERIDAGDEGGAQQLAGGLLGIACVGLGAVAIAGVLAAPWLARVLTSGVREPGVAGAQRALATFLLRFFVPQVVLYAFGAVATAVLQAQRRFTITAVAPIGNTVVMVAALIAFRVVAGTADPGLRLSLAERLLLAGGGTLGVAAFVAIPVIALWRRGFRLVPRWSHADPAVRAALRLSAWGVLQHAGTGLLLGAAIVVGNGVAGGVVAYQVAFVFFLVPYAVVAQPIHTAILPELAADAGRGALPSLAASVRWSLRAMAVLVVPASAALVALALPVMRVTAFGATSTSGARLIAAALASLAAGLMPYGAFLLFSRAYYALGDSRTPALVSVGTAALGAAAMIIVGSRTEGAGRVAVMGLAHTGAYLAAAVILGAGLARRTAASLAPDGLLRIVIGAGVLAFAARAAIDAIAPSSRATTLALLLGVGAVGAVAYRAVVKPLRAQS
jgi:putative peptidoglycan lipid II flippase